MQVCIDFMFLSFLEKKRRNFTMGSIVLKSLSILLGIFFVFVGTIKVTSYLNKDLHKDLVNKLHCLRKILKLVLCKNSVGRSSTGRALSVAQSSLFSI